LRNNIIIASRYVPAILSPCLGINLKQLLNFTVLFKFNRKIRGVDHVF